MKRKSTMLEAGLGPYEMTGNSKDGLADSERSIFSKSRDMNMSTNRIHVQTTYDVKTEDTRDMDNGDWRNGRISTVIAHKAPQAVRSWFAA